MKFSKTTRCFYPADIDYPNLPLDLIDVTKAEFDRLLVLKKHEKIADKVIKRLTLSGFHDIIKT